MSGYFIFARTWVGFSDKFPFRKFSGLPDDEINDAIEKDAINWLCSDTQTAKDILRTRKRRYREALQRGESQIIGTTMPRCTSDLNPLDRARRRQELLAWIEGVPLKGGRTPDSVVDEIIDARKPPPRAPLLKSVPKMSVRGMLAKQIRGERTDSLGVRIARVAGWAHLKGREFGGLSPSPKLWLAQVDDIELARAVVSLAGRHFGDVSDWHVNQLRLRISPGQDLGLDEQAKIQLVIKDCGSKCDDGWIGTAIHRDVFHEFGRLLTETIAVKKAKAQSFVATPFQRRILDRLKGIALKTEALAAELKCDRRKLFKKDGIKELKEIALVKSHSRLGYFRPDSPPPELKSNLPG